MLRLGINIEKSKLLLVNYKHFNINNTFARYNSISIYCNVILISAHVYMIADFKINKLYYVTCI